MFDDLVGLGDRLATLVDRLDPDALSGATANQWWGALDRVERLSAAGKTLLARRIADTHTAAFGQAKTAAEALAKRGGTSVGAARDAVETSKRLAELPQLAAAVRRGELSPAQAALVADAAAANPAAQSRLLGQAARSSMPELREECLRTKAAADPNPETTHARIHRKRFLHRFTDKEGGWNLRARGTADAGAVFNTVLDPIIDRIFHAARRDGRNEPTEAYAFDALITLATGGEPELGAGEPGTREAAPTAAARVPAGEPATGGEPERSRPGAGEPGTREPAPSVPAGGGEPGADAEPGGPPCTAAGVGVKVPDPTENPSGKAEPRAEIADDGAGQTPTECAGDPPVPDRAPAKADNAPVGAGRSDGRANAPGSAGGAGRRRMNPRFLGLLRVDLEALRRGQVAGQELCEISGVGPIPVTRARELLGDAVLHLVITRGVDVLTVTHLGRGPTAAQKVALSWMSPICIVEGCYRRRVEYDHREPWAQTRHTRLDELDPLCEYHHDLRTHHGYALVAGTGKRPVVPPDDPRHPRYRDGRKGGAGPGQGKVSPREARPGDARLAERAPDPPARQTLPDPPGDPPRAA